MVSQPVDTICHVSISKPLNLSTYLYRGGVLLFSALLYLLHPFVRPKAYTTSKVVVPQHQQLCNLSQGGSRAFERFHFLGVSQVQDSEVHSKYFRVSRAPGFHSCKVLSDGIAPGVPAKALEVKKWIPIAYIFSMSIPLKFGFWNGPLPFIPSGFDG